jgi:transcriptional regulator with XRE-family HTH domain
MREFAMRLGSNMRRARHQLELTQAQVAESIDLQVEVYGRLERGAMLPSMGLFVAICDTLGVTPNQLLGYSEPQDDLTSRSH